MTNFHYKPLWAPDKEIYSPEFSVLKLEDPYTYTDPRQYYYAPYVAARADLHEAFGSTLSYLEKRGLFDRLPVAWASLFADVVLPLRHYEGAAQMVAAHAARFGWGTTVTQCCAYASFDRIGNAQILSRVGIALGGGSAEPLSLAKTTWLQDEDFQPLRRFVEETLAEQDWGKGLVAYDIADQLLYGLFFTALDDAALGDGAGSYSLVAPTEPKELEFHVRLVPGGRGTDGWVFRDDFEVGAPVSLSGPYGRFVLHTGDDNHAVFVAGGTGLAPIKAMIRHGLENDWYSGEMTLYQGARSREWLYDVEGLSALAEEYPQFTYRPCLSEETASLVAADGDDPARYAYGMVTDVLADDHASLSGAKGYLCGPPPMVEAALKTLMSRRLFPRDIHREEFFNEGDKSRGVTSPLIKR